VRCGSLPGSAVKLSACYAGYRKRGSEKSGALFLLREEQGDELSGIARLADEALQEIRTTSYLLHPPILDEAGFNSAAQWYVDGFAKRSGI
jgi:hypothetical protein